LSFNQSQHICDTLLQNLPLLLVLEVRTVAAAAFYDALQQC